MDREGPTVFLSHHVWDRNRWKPAFSPSLSHGHTVSHSFVDRMVVERERERERRFSPPVSFSHPIHEGMRDRGRHRGMGRVPLLVGVPCIDPEKEPRAIVHAWPHDGDGSLVFLYPSTPRLQRSSYAKQKQQKQQESNHTWMDESHKEWCNETKGEVGTKIHDC